MRRRVGRCPPRNAARRRCTRHGNLVRIATVPRTTLPYRRPHGRLFKYLQLQADGAACRLAERTRRRRDATSAQCSHSIGTFYAPFCMAYLCFQLYKFTIRIVLVLSTYLPIITISQHSIYYIVLWIRLEALGVLYRRGALNANTFVVCSMCGKVW